VSLICYDLSLVIDFANDRLISEVVPRQINQQGGFFIAPLCCRYKKKMSNDTKVVADDLWAFNWNGFFCGVSHFAHHFWVLIVFYLRRPSSSVENCYFQRVGDQNAPRRCTIH
jgi:hypothetical protein